MENLINFNFDGIEKLLNMGLEIEIFYKMNSVIVSAKEITDKEKLIACNDDENILYALCGLSYKIKPEDVEDVELDNILLDDVLNNYVIRFKKIDNDIINSVIYSEEGDILKNINGTSFKECLNNLNNSLKNKKTKILK